MTTLLHRFTVKPHHLDPYLGLWAEEVAVRRRHGFEVHRAFVETDAEPKFTWLYSHADPDEGEAAVRAFPRQALHARVLGFIHPVSGEELRFEAPLPADMAALIAALDAP